jgi:hypothetical protein
LKNLATLATLKTGWDHSIRSLWLEGVGLVYAEDGDVYCDDFVLVPGRYTVHYGTIESNLFGPSSFSSTHTFTAEPGHTYKMFHDSNHMLSIRDMETGDVVAGWKPLARDERVRLKLSAYNTRLYLWKMVDGEAVAAKEARHRNHVDLSPGQYRVRYGAWKPTPGVPRRHARYSTQGERTDLVEFKAGHTYALRKKKTPGDDGPTWTLWIEDAKTGEIVAGKP